MYRFLLCKFLKKNFYGFPVWKTTGLDAAWRRRAHRFTQVLFLIGRAANFVLQTEIKSADGKAVLAFDFSEAPAAVRLAAGYRRWVRHRHSRDIPVRLLW